MALPLFAYVAWRRSRLEFERKAVLVLLALALAVYASGVLSELPDPKEAIGDIARALGPWTYLLVGVMAFLETGAFVGLVAPGETVVIAGGVIAGQGEIDLLPLIGLVWVCAVLGDTTSFYIGRRLGRRFLERHGPRVKITHERLEQVEGYFDRHGGKTILVGRFIGLVRALAPFIAGASGLSYRRFIPFSIVGTGLWSTAFCVLGYVFWRSFDKVAHIAGQAVFGFGLTVAVIVAVVVGYRRRAEIRQWLLAHERHPLVRPLFIAGRPVHRLLVRPLVRILAPGARFLQNVLTAEARDRDRRCRRRDLRVRALRRDPRRGHRADAVRSRFPRPGQAHSHGHGRGHREGRERAGLVRRRHRAADRGGRGAADTPAPARRGAARAGLRAHLPGRGRDEGGHRPATARRARS